MTAIFLFSSGLSLTAGMNRSHCVDIQGAPLKANSMTLWRLSLMRAGRSHALLPASIARIIALLVFLLAASLIYSGTAAPATEQFDFFEQKVRPLFSEHCYSCHSQKAEKI